MHTLTGPAAAVLTSSLLLGGVLLLSPWWLGASAMAIQDRPSGGQPEGATPAVDPGPAAQPASDREPADRELAELTAMLTVWADRPSWPHLEQPDENPFAIAIPADPTPEISARLASFPSRFGVGFEDCSGWQPFADAAARVYERLVDRYPAPLPGAAAAFGDRWVAPGWLSVRALLLEVTGRRDEARTLLFGEAQRYWPGCCWMCLSESLYCLAKARAEFLDRQGDTQGALLWLHEAYYQGGADPHSELFGRPRSALDILTSRYAVLLAEAGEVVAATSVQRALAESSPDSPWIALAQSAIAARHEPLEDVRSVIVFGVPLCDGSPGDTYGAGMAYIVANPEQPSAWRLLAIRLPKFPDRKAGGRLLPDHGTDLEVVDPADPRVLPFLEGCLAQPEGWKWSRALLALHALGQASRQQLITCLEWTVVDGSLSQAGSTGAAIDEAARVVAGGGPTLSQPLDRITLRDLRTEWLEWLR